MTDATQSDVPAVDLDNPESWPIDAAGLAGLAAGEDQAEEAKARGADKSATPEKAAVAPGAGDVAGAAAADAKAAADLVERKGADPEGVLTRDGKHIIPFAVLKGEREAHQALQEHTAALTAELEALKKVGGAEGTATPGQGKPATVAGDLDVPAEIKGKAEQLREDYGDDFADQWLENYRLKAEFAAVRTWMNTEKSARATAESATQKTAQDDMQGAIDAVPLLAEWQVDREHPEWYTAANEVYQMLTRTSAAYRAMPLAERMTLLPARVEALYGQSPHSARKTDEADATKAAADAIGTAALRRPASLSDIPGGERPAGSEAERLEAMTAAQLQATIEGIAAKGPDKLEAFLRGVEAA